MGSLLKDKHQGKLVEMYNATMAGAGVKLVDVAAGFAEVFTVKEGPELINHKKVRLPAARAAAARGAGHGAPLCLPGVRVTKCAADQTPPCA